MKINLKEIREKNDLKNSVIPREFILEKLKTKGFFLDEQNKNIVDLVLSYFLRDKKFLDSDLVKSENSFNKGLLIFGDYGIGKSFLFESLHFLGKDIVINTGVKDLWFNKISAGSFIDDYMTEVTKRNEDKKFRIEDYYKGRLYIDDLGFEKLAFGKTELLAELLFERNRKKVPTFVTTNLTPNEITKRYGMRIGDRLPEMFNIIQWRGESYRK